MILQNKVNNVLDLHFPLIVTSISTHAELLSNFIISKLYKELINCFEKHETLHDICQRTKYRDMNILGKVAVMS